MSESTANPATSGARSFCDGLAGLQERLGTDLGVSSWRTVDPGRHQHFAKLTGDEQWIHVDPERAKTGLLRHDHPARVPDPRPGHRVPLGGLHDRRVRRRAELRPEQGSVSRPR